MNALDKVKKLDQLTEDKLQVVQDFHEAQFEAILVKEGMEAFVLWAKAFPKRELRFVSGMGTCTFACPTLDSSGFLLDLDDYCDDAAESRKIDYSPRAAAMIQPLIDFYKLFWSSDMYQYPALYDFLYNPITRTVEYHDQIIYLDL